MDSIIAARGCQRCGCFNSFFIREAEVSSNPFAEMGSRNVDMHFNIPFK